MNPLVANTLLLLAITALLAGLYAFWRSLTSALTNTENPQVELDSEDDPLRRELLDERRSLLETLRDLKHDLETGKLSQADFDEIDGRTRARAKDVLRELDAQIEPYRDRAEALVGESVKS